MPAFHLPDGEDVCFLELTDIHMFHDIYALAEGNLPGLLDVSKLEGGLARPRNLLAYDQPRPDLIKLAAILWHGISEAHGYQDANKRTAFLAMTAFLLMNGVTLDAGEFDPALMILQWYAQKDVRPDRMEAFLRAHCRWTT
ncbi:type II toxin-antitoxin system death-on-curing family toxin [Frigidibacter mobilis]|uniref:Death-on-curing family protein n=1 Tax=Frigidibacter mobilis TaxID=1335048 RepID=A0A159ZAM4_9RHOB|nr:Fic family protein [Frigidibacter mobilis]AMY71940.1 death-on-curing family protein [Frigidibacter mobilis]